MKTATSTARPDSREPQAKPQIPGTFIPFDTSFGIGGVVAGFAPSFAYKSDSRRLPDGRLLVAGYVRPVGSPDQLRQAVGMFGADGRPESGFGEGGIAVIGGAPTTATVPNVRVAAQPDGRILVGVAVKVGESQQWVLTRVTPDGRLDASFSGDGRLVVSFPGEPKFLSLTAILVQPDNKILVVGFRDDSQLCVARYLPNGSRDRTFGDEGKLQRDLPGVKARVSSAKFDGNGGVLIGGSTGMSDTGFDMLAARFAADWEPDDAFGFEGSAVVDFGTGSDAGQQMMVGDDGRIVVAGAAEASFGETEPALLRLLPDGSVDDSFGSGGMVRLATGKGPGHYAVTALDQFSDGRIAVAGTYKAEEQGDPDHDVPKTFVALVRSDGSPDTSFDAGLGVVFVGPGSAVSPPRLAVVAGDKLLVTMSDSLIRLNSATAFSALRLEIGADQNPAGPGPLTFFVTVHNNGSSASGGLLRLRASKAVSIVSGTHGSYIVEPNRVDVIGKLSGIPAGGQATLALRTTVNGFEEGISLSGSISRRSRTRCLRQLRLNHGDRLGRGDRLGHMRVRPPRRRIGRRFRGHGAIGSAPALQAGGYGFESRWLHHDEPKGINIETVETN